MLKEYWRIITTSTYSPILLQILNIIGMLLLGNASLSIHVNSPSQKTQIQTSRKKSWMHECNSLYQVAVAYTIIQYCVQKSIYIYIWLSEVLVFFFHHCPVSILEISKAKVVGLVVTTSLGRDPWSPTNYHFMWQTDLISFLRWDLGLTLSPSPFPLN